MGHNGFFVSARPEGTKTFKAKENLKRFQQSTKAVEAINIETMLLGTKLIGHSDTLKNFLKKRPK